jgi:hypothetical protein
MRFLLLDIDGVLLEPHGYRKSYRDTVNLFLASFGFPELQVDDSIAELFEYYGIPAEWDMVPLTLAAFLSWYVENSPIPKQFQTLNDLKNLAPIDADTGFIDQLRLFIPKVAACINGAGVPAAAVYKNCKTAKEESCLPAVWDQPVLADLLGNSINVNRSLPFRVLETFVLGTEEFEKHFGITTDQGILSNLELADIPILSKEFQERISAESGVVYYSAVMTARPNLLPVEIEKPELLVSSLPEAELAMTLFGWDEGRMKICGAGTLHYYEQRFGYPQESRLKPSAMHALWAMIESATGSFQTAFDLLSKWDLEQPVENPFAGVFPPEIPIEIAVFEDSASGVRSAAAAADVLRAYGYQVKLDKYGIITTDGKRRLLEAQDAKIFPNVNEALTDYFSKMNL